MSDDVLDNKIRIQETPHISRGTLSLIVKALFYIYFGLFISVLLLFTTSFISLTSFIQIPAYVIGSVIMCYGLLLLNTDKSLKTMLGYRSKILLFLSGLHIYFAPFIRWWIENPLQPIFFINVLIFVLVNIMILFFLNLTIAKIYFLTNSTERIGEAYFGAASVLFLMLLPFLVWIGGAIFRIIRYQSDFIYEITYGAVSVFEVFPSFSSLWLFKKSVIAVMLLFLLPLPHTLAVMWRAAKLCKLILAKQKQTL